MAVKSLRKSRKPHDGGPGEGPIGVVPLRPPKGANTGTRQTGALFENAVHHIRSGAGRGRTERSGMKGANIPRPAIGETRTTPQVLWNLWPLAGWGLGLAIHATVVLLAASPLRERMEADELRRLQ